MLDYGFAEYERATLFDVGKYSYSYAVAGGVEDYVCAINSQPIVMTLPKHRGDQTLAVEFPQRFEIAPIEAQEPLGQLSVCINGRVARSPLVAAYSVQSNAKSHKFFG